MKSDLPVWFASYVLPLSMPSAEADGKREPTDLSSVLLNLFVATPMCDPVT